MSASKRELALVDLMGRLGRISIDNGFETDGGAVLFVYEDAQLGPDDPIAIQVEVGPDRPTVSGRRINAELPIQVQALVYTPAFGSVRERIHAVEGLLADIKKAVEIDEGEKSDLQHSLEGTLPRGLLRGVTLPLKRETGSEIVGVAVEYTAVIQEAWGEP